MWGWGFFFFLFPPFPHPLPFSLTPPRLWLPVTSGRAGSGDKKQGSRAGLGLRIIHPGGGNEAASSCPAAWRLGFSTEGQIFPRKMLGCAPKTRQGWGAEPLLSSQDSRGVSRMDSRLLGSWIHPGLGFGMRNGAQMGAGRDKGAAQGSDGSGEDLGLWIGNVQEPRCACLSLDLGRHRIPGMWGAPASLSIPGV